MHIQDLFSVNGKIALVTGGSRGIGEMIAAGFLANGAKVYISSRKADACRATADRLMEQYGGTCGSIASRQAWQSQFTSSCRSANRSSGSVQATHTGGKTNSSAARISGLTSRHRAEWGGGPG